MRARRKKVNKKLGFGMMRLPLTDKNDKGSYDAELVKKMVDAFMTKGFNYFDTAWMYVDGKSECAVKQCLVNRYPRDSYTVTTKLHAGFINSFEDRDKIFNKQLEKTGLDYFDYYWLHDVNNETYPIYEKYDCFNWIFNKKESGLVKHIGFSFHAGPKLLEEVLSKYPQFEYVQLQLNYLDWESQSVQSRKCYEVCVKYHKPVIVMEPVKGGTLAKLPKKAEELLLQHNKDMSIPSWAIRFAASLDNVYMVLSGMSDLQQMEDNISYMENFIPLNEEEKSLCLQVADIINDSIEIPCTGCNYCAPNCPMGICIPEYFHVFNLDKKEIKEKSWTPQIDYYNNLKSEHGKPQDCLECGQCEEMCPQHLPIRELLKKVSNHFE